MAEMIVTIKLRNCAIEYLNFINYLRTFAINITLIKCFNNNNQKSLCAEFG